MRGTATARLYGVVRRGCWPRFARLEIVQFTWTDAAHRVVGTSAHVRDLPPGVYSVTAADGRRQQTAVVEVARGAMPVVVSYDTTMASHEAAWDGSVRAIVENVTTQQYLWSNGQTTVLPELTALRPGTYSVSLLDPDHRAMPYVHATTGADVGFRV